MANLNKVMLIGNLTRDPELKYTPKGSAVAEFGLAVNRVWYDENKDKKEEATFIDVTLWGRNAEVAQQYLVKGNPCYIEGRLVMDTWDDKATGQKRSKLKVVGESLQLLGAKEKERADGLREPQGARSPEYGKPAPTNSGRGMPNAPEQRDNSAADHMADDIPFMRFNLI